MGLGTNKNSSKGSLNSSTSPNNNSPSRDRDTETDRDTDLDKDGNRDSTEDCLLAEEFQCKYGHKIATIFWIFSRYEVAEQMASEGERIGDENSRNVLGYFYNTPCEVGVVCLALVL